MAISLPQDVAISLPQDVVISLPQDVMLFHILTRVPAKSVCRFKRVSKEWNSFLSNDIFKEMHNRNIDNQQSDLKLLQLEHTKYYGPHFSIFNCEVPRVPSPWKRPLPPPFKAAAHPIRILASFHGLVCVGIKKPMYCYYYPYYAYTELILWNPLTTEYKMLSRPSSESDHVECYENSKGTTYGLYYISSQDDYKLLVVTGNVCIYSLRSDSWIKRNKAFPSYIFCKPESSACLNGNLYFLIKDDQKKDDPKSYSITRYDTNTEDFQKLKPPLGYENNQTSNYYATVMVQRGCIHFCVRYDFGKTYPVKSTCIQLWKLNGDGDNWTKVVTYQLRPDDVRYLLPLCPLYWMRNGNWLMKSYVNRRPIVDLEKMKKYSNHKSKGKGINKSKVDDTCIVYVDNGTWIHEEIQYTESFMSPNRCMS